MGTSGRMLARLREARAHLAAVVERGDLPSWLREAAAGCVDDIDGVLAPGAPTPARLDRLIAQAETLASASRRTG